MPRKASLGPGIVRIETMSDGREWRSREPMVDDFTGQPIEPIPDATPARVLPSAQELLDDTNRKRRAAQRILLRRVGIIKD